MMNELDIESTRARLTADEAARNIDTLAEGLEKLAQRLRGRADAMRSVSVAAEGGASSMAGEVVSEYVRFGGQAGARLEQLLMNAAGADRAYWSARIDLP